METLAIFPGHRTRKRGKRGEWTDIHKREIIRIGMRMDQTQRRATTESQGSNILACSWLIYINLLDKLWTPHFMSFLGPPFSLLTRFPWNRNQEQITSSSRQKPFGVVRSRNTLSEGRLDGWPKLPHCMQPLHISAKWISSSLWEDCFPTQFILSLERPNTRRIFYTVISSLPPYRFQWVRS